MDELNPKPFITTLENSNVAYVDGEAYQVIFSRSQRDWRWEPRPGLNLPSQPIAEISRPGVRLGSKNAHPILILEDGTAFQVFHHTGTVGVGRTGDHGYGTAHLPHLDLSADNLADAHQRVRDAEAAKARAKAKREKEAAEKELRRIEADRNALTAKAAKAREQAEKADQLAAEAEATSPA